MQGSLLQILAQNVVNKSGFPIFLAGFEAGNLPAPVRGTAASPVHKPCMAESRMAALSEKQGLLSSTFREQGACLCYFTEQNLYFHIMLQKRRLSADLCPARKVQHLISAD